MIKKILLILAVLIAGIIIVSRFQPDSYTVERTATISAPPPMVFAQLNDFHSWERFNPGLDLDSNMVLTYEGPESGVGARCHWVGNSNAGAGSMTVVESRPFTSTKIDMHFLEPMEGRARTEFKLAPEGNGTQLTWSMTGEHNFFSRIICMFMSMDKAIGGQYEKGFERMNAAFGGTSNAALPGPSVFDRTFNAPVEAVWNAWTRPEEHMKWWGPRMFSCPVARMDVKPGGSYHVAMRGPDGRDFWNTGTYGEVVPLRKLTFTVQFADSLGTVVPAAQLGMPGQWPDAVNTTITMREADGKTHFELVEDGVPAEMRKLSEQGMNECLDKLASLVEKRMQP